VTAHATADSQEKTNERACTVHTVESAGKSCNFRMKNLLPSYEFQSVPSCFIYSTKKQKQKQRNISVNNSGLHELTVTVVTWSVLAIQSMLNFIQEEASSSSTQCKTFAKMIQSTVCI
jgi:hypothetical protein